LYDEKESSKASKLSLVFVVFVIKPNIESSNEIAQCVEGVGASQDAPLCKLWSRK
jgi:hypothetical protein